MFKQKKYLKIAVVVLVLLLGVCVYVNSEFAVTVLSEEEAVGTIGKTYFSEKKTFSKDKYNVEINAKDINEVFDSPTLYSTFLEGDNITVVVQEYERIFKGKDIRIKLIIDDHGFVVMD